MRNENAKSHWHKTSLINFLLYFDVAFFIILSCVLLSLGKSSKDTKGKEKEKEKEANKELSSVQAVATLGVAVIALGEETGAEMCTRIFGQLVRTTRSVSSFR